MSTDTKRYVTHYYRRSPDPAGWIQTNFITKQEGNDNFYLGFGNKIFPSAKVTRDIESGSLKAVTPSLIHNGETLWITSEQDIGIASSTNPFQTDLNIIDRDDVGVPEPKECQTHPDTPAGRFFLDKQYGNILQGTLSPERSEEIRQECYSQCR